MKTLICLIAVCLLLNTGAVAQKSVIWAETQTLSWGNPANVEDYAVHAYFKNTTAETLKCSLTEASRNFKSGDFISVCWDICYTTDDPNRRYPLVEVAPGAISNNLVAHFIPSQALGVRTARYIISTGMGGDTLMADFLFNVTPAGVTKTVKVSGVNFNAFPNPAATATTIQYAFNGPTKNANLTLYNMLGAAVQTLPIDENSGSVQLNLKNLTPGVYFYALEIDGKKAATKRLVVTR